MKLAAKVKLLTDATQFRALRNTLESANAACDWISDQAWKAKEFSNYGIHKLAYREARARFGLSAQIAARCDAKVADAYKLDQNSKRTFRPTGSIAYDDRILTRHSDKQIVSIRAESGRLRIPFAGGARQLELLKLPQGESDLILHQRAFYLAAICNVEQPSPADVEEFLGVDFGATNIAADSDGRSYSGIEVKSVRHRQRRLRTRLIVLYKAALAGVLAVQVDPRNSSRECSECGHVDKANRPSQSKFSCRSCGFNAHTDWNAASVLARRAECKRP